MAARAYLHAEHAPLWSLPMFIELAKRTGSDLVSFPMCSFGSPWQKLTTLMYTPGLSSWMKPLARLLCTHDTHERAAGGEKSADGWNSSEVAAYPADFNHYVAQAFGALRLRS
jgi:hypothetical protein